MRRNSPPRFGRRFSPPSRRRSRHRSVSPIPLIEDISMPKWDIPRPPPERQRQRSRSRERLPRPRNRSRERNRDRDTDRKEHFKEKPRGKNIRDRKREDQHFQDSFRGFKEEIPPLEVEESYLDGRPLNFHPGFKGPPIGPDVPGPSRIITNHHERSPNNVQKITGRSPNRVHSNPDSSQSHQNNENVDRIGRLEKLLEKLVQGNVKPNDTKYGESTVKNDDGIPELIPSNSKFTTSMWLNRLHEECLQRNYNEKSCIKFVQSKMTGIIKAWFKTVSSYDFTWPELKLLITKTFPDNNDFAQTLRMLVDREKFTEETITQYFFSKMYLCEACKVTGENAVSCLIDGLPNPFMKQDLRSCNYLTPENLFSELLQKFHNNEKVGPSDREVETYEGSLREFRKEENFKGDIARCATCKKFGHFTVDCRHAPICYKCKKKGHIAAKCSFHGLLYVDNAEKGGYLVKCEVNGFKLDGQVDTGCDVVTMKKYVAEKLDLKVIPSSKVLVGYGGGMINVIGEARIKLKVDLVERVASVMVVPNKSQEFSVIIGRDYLNQDGVMVLIDEKKLKIFPKDMLNLPKDPVEINLPNEIICSIKTPRPNRP